MRSLFLAGLMCLLFTEPGLALDITIDFAQKGTGVNLPSGPNCNGAGAALKMRETRMASWNIQGQYMETCNCDFICPCIGSNLTARPTEGDCKAAIALRIDEGRKDGVALDGLAFIVLAHSPGPRADGNIKVGLIVDENADDAQTEAISQIATGAAGGPMTILAPLVSEIVGVEKRPIRFEVDGLNRAVMAGELIDQALTGVPSLSKEGEPICLDNTAHPVSDRLALAKATHSRFHAFGIDWDDASGLRNGHFAPFSWAA
ncbi:MAG: DUF1326 domain-containing protein [Gammaproteobacteria bacterium]